MAKIPSETGETVRLERLLKKIRGSSFLFFEADSTWGGGGSEEKPHSTLVTFRESSRFVVLVEESGSPEAGEATD